MSSIAPNKYQRSVLSLDSEPAGKDSFSNLARPLINKIFSTPAGIIDKNPATSSPFANSKYIYSDPFALRSCLQTSKLFRNVVIVRLGNELKITEQYIKDLIPQLEGKLAPEQITLLRNFQIEFSKYCSSISNPGKENLLKRLVDTNQTIISMLSQLDETTLQNLQNTQNEKQTPRPAIFENVFRVAEICKLIPRSLTDDPMEAIGPSQILGDLMEAGETEQALIVANHHYKTSKATDFALVANSFHESTITYPAISANKIALSFIDTVADNDRENFLELVTNNWSEIAERLIYRNKLDQASAVANLMHDENRKHSTLSEINEKLDTLRNTEEWVEENNEALANVNKMLDEDEKTQTLRSVDADWSSISENFLSYEKFTQAQEVAKKIQNVPMRAGTVRKIAERMAVFGKINEAILLTATIPIDSEKSAALKKIISAIDNPQQNQESDLL